MPRFCGYRPAALNGLAFGEEDGHAGDPLVAEAIAGSALCERANREGTINSAATSSACGSSTWILIAAGLQAGM